MSEPDICRFCLQIPQNGFIFIDETTRGMLDVLFVKIDFGVSDNPVMCKDCALTINSSLSFMSACIDSEEKIVLSNPEKNKVNIDIRDVYALNTDEKLFSNFHVCRFCLKRTEEGNFHQLDVLKRDKMFLDMLNECMSQMDLNIVRNPLICFHCRDSLETYYKFLRNWRDTENRINEYRENKQIEKGEKIVLGDVLDWYSVVLGICAVKMEPPDDMEDTQEELDTEREPVDASEFETSPDNRVTEPVNTQNQSLGMGNKVLRVNLVRLDIENLQKVKTGKNVQIFQCANCDFQTEYKRSLRKHVVTHKIRSEKVTRLEFDFKCNYCGHRFKSESSLATHIKRGHVMQFCPLCNYKTNRSGDFSRHKLIHKTNSETKMYKCDICGFQSKHKRSIVLHGIVHQDPAEVHKCALCPYEGKAKYLLTKHMRSHAKKPQTQQCSECPYTTHQPSLLNMHMLTHKSLLEVEAFTCDVEGCDYITKWKSDLKRHALTHRGVFKCGQCEFETRVKRKIGPHLASHGISPVMERNVKEKVGKTADSVEVEAEGV